MKGLIGNALTVAGCQLGGVAFAVAMEDVQQLLARPARWTHLPRREGALVGAVQLREGMVPVVDLRRWLPWPEGAAASAASLAPPAAPPAPELLLVLRQGTQRVAVGIDAVAGLRRVNAAGAQMLVHGGASDELFSSVVCPAGSAEDAMATDTGVALLDVAALMRLSRVWADGPAESHAADVPSAAMRNPATRSVACALLDCEGEHLVVAAAHLRAVVAMPALQVLWAGDPHRLGVARWRDRDVPVLRLLPSLGLSAATPTSPPLLAVVEHDGVCMGLPVHGVRDVRRLDLQALQSLDAIGAPPAALQSRAVGGVLPLPDGARALVLDVPAWVGSDPMAQLSAARHAGGAQQSAAVAATEAHVVVRAGVSWALPLSGVLEIIESPPAWAGHANSGTGLQPCGHTWRQRAVPLWDLRALMGHGPTPPDSDAKVLIVQAGAQVVGLVVEALLQLVPARTAELPRLRRADGRSLPFVVHGQGAAQQSFALLGEADWKRSLPN